MAYTDIDNPELYFQTVLWTGNGSNRSITLDGSENMQPDWVWGKNRGNDDNDYLMDSVRGATKFLTTNNQTAESTSSTLLTSFDSDGFSLGTSAGLNASGVTAVGWCWKASGSTASNSDGSVTSSVSANTTAGFSIITYTGTGSVGTIGHGLNSAPELVILRNRAVTSSWWTWGELIGNVNILELQSTAAKNNPNGNYHNDTMPTSSVISFGSDGQVSGSGQSHICYAFHSVKGYSKIGSYTGNGSLDAPFIHLGFLPAWLMIKRTDTTNSWVMFDNKRNAFNVVDKHLFANTIDPEDSSANYNEVDFLSNGFKLREDNNTINASGGTYIYMAFAESPFVNSNGVPNNAR